MGEFGGLNLAGDDDGVEGPRNDASRLMESEFKLDHRMFKFVFDSNLGAKLYFFIFLQL